MALDCAISTQAQASKIEQHYGTDKLTYDEFKAVIEQTGLLSVKYFKNRYTPISNSEIKSTIASIIGATEMFAPDNLLKSGQPIKKYCYLNQKEIFSLFYYTGEGYNMLNMFLRNANVAEIKKMKIITDQILSAFAKIKPYVGYAKRGQVLSENLTRAQNFLTSHQKGSVVTYLGYTSTTVSTPFAGNLKFLLYLEKNCRYIGHFSLIDVAFFSGTGTKRPELEVLCLPNTRFHVVDTAKIKNEYKFVLREIM